MSDRKYEFYVLSVVLVAIFVVVYFILRPFFNPLVLAASSALFFQPLYKQMARLTRGRRGLAAFITTVAVIVLFLLPLVFLGIQIFHESGQLYISLTDGNGMDGLMGAFENLIARLRIVVPIPEGFELDFNQYLREGSDIITRNLGSIFSSVGRLLTSVFIFLIAFYFFLKDGYKLKKYFIALSPLTDSNDELILNRLRLAISSVIKGGLSLGIIQGILTGIGCALFGVPNPVLWGSAAAIASLIPGIGTALVLVPAIIYLFLTGSAFSALGLLVWGMTAVGLIDNLLGPRLVGRGMQLHPLVVFLSVLGGLAFFGPLGFLLGPLVMSLCFALIEMYFLSLHPKYKQ